MIAEVILNSNAKDLDRTFDYEIPKDMQYKIKIGSRVLVPFGKRKILEEGFVVNIKETTEFKTKEIVKIEENPFIDESKIKLAKWISKRYFANFSDSLKLMLPPGTTTNKQENRIKEKTDKFVYLIRTKEEIIYEIETKKIKSEKQIRILKFLIDNNEILLSDLETFTDTSRAIIKTLEKNGYLQIIEKQIDRNPFLNKKIQKTNKLEFTDEQREAYKKIENTINNNIFSEFLLFGITGSRKNRNIPSSNRKCYKRRKNKYIISS